MRYNGFISYSHAADGKLAPAIQSALHSFAKPWYKLRNLRVFRDKTSLSANPALWTSIEDALKDSDYFLLMASPQAAQSTWVQREVGWWLQNHSTAKLIILLTEGTLVWDKGRQDFDWRETSALPPNMAEQFKEEPFYVDFSFARDRNTLSLRNSQFHSAILDVAAPLHGRAKDDLDGDDVRQHRKARRLLYAAITALVLLTTLAIIQSIRAVQQARIALARQLAAQSELVLKQHPDRLEQSVLLGVESLKRFVSVDTDRALRTGLNLLAPTSHEVAVLDEGEIRDLLNGNLFVPECFPDPTGKSLAVLKGAENRHLQVYHLARDKVIEPVGDVRVTAFAFSPDGTSAAIATQQNVQVAENMDGRVVLQFRHGSPVTAVTFSPDGKYLIAASEHAVEAWDVPRRSRLWLVPEKQTLQGQIAFDRSSRRFAMVTQRTALVRDTVSGRVVWRGSHNACPPDSGQCYVAISPSGRYVAVAGDVFTVLVWDINERRRIGELVGSGLTGLAFSANDHHVAYKWVDHSVRFWDTIARVEVGRIVHDQDVRTVAFSPDGRFIATGAQDGTARIWDGNTFHELGRINHDGIVVGVAFSGNAELLFSWDDRGGVKVTRVRGSLMASGFAGNVWEGVWTVALSRDGIYGAAILGMPTADANFIEIWEPAQGLRKMRESHNGATRLMFSPKAEYLASAGKDPVKVWDPRSGKQVATISHGSFALGLDFGPEGRLAIGLRDRTAGIWDIATGKRLATMNHSHAVNSIRFSPDGKYLATTCSDDAFKGPSDNTVWLWEAGTGRQVAALKHDGLVSAVVFSEDSRFVATGSKDGKARLWQPTDGKELSRIDLGDEVADVALSPDGRYIAAETGGLLASGHSLFVCRVSSGRELMKVGHEESIDGISFTPDSAFLIAHGEDSVRIWEIAKAKEVVQLGGPIQQSTLSKNGSVLAVTVGGLTYFTPWRSEDLLNEACSKLSRNLSTEEWEYYIGGRYHKTCVNLPAP